MDTRITSHIDDMNTAAQYGYRLSVADGLIEQIACAGHRVSSVSVIGNEISIQVRGDWATADLADLLAACDVADITDKQYKNLTQVTGRTVGVGVCFYAAEAKA